MKISPKEFEELRQKAGVYPTPFSLETVKWLAHRGETEKIRKEAMQAFLRHPELKVNDIAGPPPVNPPH